ncbi:sensor histidine kinase [Chryseolinea serpens]|uniref:sensor histidine kinase n=1 Tax=Chryseolinea serpens TaxID=947013 RepID=UPI0015B82E78|nr:tetratricopeptide repeat-containing sensor histidine kinase [Chryseolinea serpens]
MTLSTVLTLSISYGQPGSRLEDSLMLDRGLVSAGRNYLSEPDSSIRRATTILTEALRLRNRYYEGRSYYLLSKAHWAKASYRLSAEFGFKALKIFENSSYIREWGESLVSLSRTFIDLQNYDESKMYLDRAAQLARDHNSPFLLADSYRERSMLLLAQQQYDSALQYANKALDILEPRKDTVDISVLYGRKARIYFSLKDYKQSRIFNRRSMHLDSLVGNRRALAVSLYQAAQNSFYLHHYDSAIYFLERGIPMNASIGNLLSLIRMHNLLSEIYTAQGKSLMAVDHLRKAAQYRDSLYEQQRSGHVQELQSLYESEKKADTIFMLENENELKQQQMRNQRLVTWFLSVGIFSLTALIFVLWRLRAQQKKANDALSIKNKAIEQQKEEIQAQAESLQELNHLKSKLFSVISHDLRGPINNLQSLLELVTNRIMQPEEFLAISDKLKSNLNVTQRTLENLLNWSLSQMEGLRTEQKKFEIKSVMEEACRLMEDLAHRKNIIIENTTRTPVMVMADPDQVQLILRNLIHNAIKFSKTDGKVLVSASEHHDECHVRIKDFGIGMTQEEKEMILSSQEYFTKIGTQQEKGTGLGLLLCKEFIHRNGGTLTIDSHPGHGTEITFTLPLGEK